MARSIFSKILPNGLAVWLLGGLLVRGTIATLLPPGFDEAYYYLYTRHLDWSYFDHPLLVAWTTGIGVWLTGQVLPLTIRLGPVLLYTVSLGLLYWVTSQSFSDRAGRMAVAIASLAPIFQVGFGVLTLPDSPLIAVWTLAMGVAVQEFSREPYEPTVRVSVLGLLVGLACLGKYHGVFLGLGLVGFCLSHPSYRRVFTSRWLWGAIGLFGGAIAPILIWNFQHDWVSLRFQSGRAIPDRGYQIGDMLVTVLAGIGYLFPTLGGPLWWSLIRFTRRPATPIASLFLWLSLPLIGVFTLMGGYRAILPTWTMPGFWSALPLLGALAATWSEKNCRRWLIGSGVSIAVLMAIALSHITLGTLQTPSRYALFGGFLPATQDASVQFLDIQQFRQRLRHSLPTWQQARFLFTDDIFLAGQIGMAIAPVSDIPVTCFDKDSRGFAFWSRPSEWVGEDGLLVVDRALADVTVKKFRPYFETITPLPDLTLDRGGVPVRTFQLYHAHRLLRPYPRPYGLRDNRTISPISP